MGLDSYILKRNYVNTYADCNKITKDNDTNNFNSIFEEEVHWRRAYYIHNWMVKNIQNDVDNCAIYYVSSHNLNKLLELCKKDLEYLKSLKDIRDVNENNIHLKTLIYNKEHITSLEYSVEKLSNIVLNDDPNDYSYSYYYEGNW